MRAVRLLILVGLAVAVGCGSSKPSKTRPTRIDPPLTDSASRASLCKACDPKRDFCNLLVGSGPEGGTPHTSASCGALPRECRGKTDCRCFPALKGCRCQHTSHGFDLECPAP